VHWRDQRERDIPMQRSDTAFGFDTWSATVLTEGTGKTASYYFTLVDGPTSKTYGASTGTTAKTVQWLTADLTERFPTPAWAKNVVWYQIFPERFRNGSIENDPPHTLPWRWDWYKAAAGEQLRENGKFSNNWYGRRFGGDFQGALKMLPYFRELGVTALYFCPVFESNSNHGYDTTDYRHISQYFGFKGDNEEVIAHETLDPKTWQWTPSDKLFLQFVKAAHAQGLKVIVDGVFNHMGRNSFALRDVLTNGKKSPYADWFEVTDWGPPVKYRSWDGGGSMPVFHKDSQKGYASDSAKQYIFNVTRRWMDPNGDGDPSDGIDGWRLDVAQDVPAPFWIDWRKHVKGINSNAYITGEIWGLATQYLQGDEWDAVMNYQFAMRSIHYFIDHKRKISATEFDHQLKQLLASYPMQVNYVMQNLYDSHDTDRLANMIANPDRNYDSDNRPQNGGTYDGSKPGPAAYRVLKLMATFQMTFLGAPMIWYGDEAGMFGADDPTDRKPMLWRDLEPYDNPQDAVMQDVLDHYRRVIAIRNTYPALRTGQFQTFLTDDQNDLYGFTRSRANEVVAVIINNSDKDQSPNLTVPFPNGSRVVDILAATPVEFHQASMQKLGFPSFERGATVRAIHADSDAEPSYTVHDGKIHIRLPHKSAAILVKE
jgi:glycosidase